MLAGAFVFLCSCGLLLSCLFVCSSVVAGLSTLAGPTVLVKLDNLTRLELNVLRPFLLKALKQFDALAPPQDQQQ